ncbi:MAG: hypothetical protein AB1705_08485 [Verrucomicrobiota bacterium]
MDPAAVAAVVVAKGGIMASVAEMQLLNDSFANLTRSLVNRRMRQEQAAEAQRREELQKKMHDDKLASDRAAAEEGVKQAWASYHLREKMHNDQLEHSRNELAFRQAQANQAVVDDIAKRDAAKMQIDFDSGTGVRASVSGPPGPVMDAMGTVTTQYPKAPEGAVPNGYVRGPRGETLQDRTFVPPQPDKPEYVEVTTKSSDGHTETRRRVPSAQFGLDEEVKRLEDARARLLGSMVPKEAKDRMDKLRIDIAMHEGEVARGDKRHGWFAWNSRADTLNGLKAELASLQEKFGTPEQDPQIRRLDEALTALRGTAPAAAAPPAAASAAAEPKQITTKEQFDALPSGAEYIGKDGKLYRKP